jgi:cyclophilin family peptidyl-prolyl cis-trans isomerase
VPVSTRTINLLYVLTASSMAVGIGACGSSATHKVPATSHVSLTANGHGTQPTSAHGCRVVNAPNPKGAQRIPKPTITLDPAKHYSVRLETNCGKIEIELAVEEAPKTSSSFAYLVKRGFYDDLTFHRVASGYVIQGGDPNGDGSGGPGYTVVEPPPGGLHYTFGTVAMAKTEADPPGASGSQFFIVTAHSTALPPQYALVGRVVGSFSAVNAIGTLATDPPQDGAPTIPVVISRATLASN